MGDLDFVVCEFNHEVVRRICAFGEALGDFPAHLALDVMDELAQDVAHQRPFAVAEFALAFEEQVLDRREQGLAPGLRLLVGQGQQRIEIGNAVISELQRRLLGHSRPICRDNSQELNPRTVIPVVAQRQTGVGRLVRSALGTRNLYLH